MWVGIALASLAALITIALSVPLDVVLDIDIHGRLNFKVRLVWLFGLVDREMRGRKKPEREKLEWGKGARAIFKIMRIKGLPAQLKRLLMGIIRNVRFRKVEADFRVGLDDPADTGLLFASIGPAVQYLDYFTRHRIRVQPSFDEAVIEGWLSGGMRVLPIQLVPTFIRFAFSLAMLRILKAMVLSKWKRKR